MTPIFKAVVAVSGLGLAACVGTPEQYETEPVVLETAKGRVTCQLYTNEVVLWDRAIQWPSVMDFREADAICKSEGQRRANLLRNA